MFITLGAYVRYRRKNSPISGLGRWGGGRSTMELEWFNMAVSISLVTLKLMLNLLLYLYYVIHKLCHIIILFVYNIEYAYLEKSYSKTNYNSLAKCFTYLSCKVYI